MARQMTFDRRHAVSAHPDAMATTSLLSSGDDALTYRGRHQAASPRTADEAAASGCRQHLDLHDWRRLRSA